MKHAGVAHIATTPNTRTTSSIPRGWIVLGAALAAWLIVIALIVFSVHLFGALATLI